MLTKIHYHEKNTTTSSVLKPGKYLYCRTLEKGIRSQIFSHLGPWCVGIPEALGMSPGAAKHGRTRWRQGAKRGSGPGQRRRLSSASAQKRLKRAILPAESGSGIGPDLNLNKGNQT